MLYISSIFFNLNRNNIKMSNKDIKYIFETHGNSRKEATD